MKAIAMPLHVGLAGPFDLEAAAHLLNPPIPPGRGYATQVSVKLAEALLARGHRVTVFTTSVDPNDVGRYRGRGFEIIVVPMRRRKRWPDFFRAERKALVSAMRAHPCDVVHAHWTYEFAIAAMRARTAPVVVTVHDWGPEVLRRQRHPYRLVRLLMQAYVLVRAPSLTANSPYIAEKVRRWYRRTIPVVPNGIDVPEALPERSGSRGLTIGSVNNGFGERKNVQRLIDAFKVIRQERPDAALRLVGADFQLGGPAQQYARETDAVEGIEFVGPIPASRIATFMRSIDVLVHPSLEESFGMTLVEAIVEGTLVIGGRESGAVPWVLGDGEAGTLVDVSDPDAICQAALGLPSDPTDLNDRRQRALDHVRDHFSLDRVVDQYEELYRDILQRGTPDTR